MNYLILGTGGTGGCIGAFLAKQGKDVTFIARGTHLKAMQEQGLKVYSDKIGDFVLPSVKAYDMETYEGTPDVIFVCVKGYSIEETLPFIKKIATKNTLIIPILNIYGTGDKMAQTLTDLTVLNGCMYIVSYVSNDGEITQKGKLFRVVYGMRDCKTENPMLAQIETDLVESGIDALCSHHIRRDTFRKFIMLSPYASTGAYYHVAAGAMQKEGPSRTTYELMVREVCEIAKAMGLVFETDMVAEALNILDHMTPDSTASMQKDMAKGGKTEMDGLLFEAIRMGRKLGVAIPTYEMVGGHFGFTQ